MAWQPTPKKKKEKKSSPLPFPKKKKPDRSYTVWFTHDVLIYYLKVKNIVEIANFRR